MLWEQVIPGKLKMGAHSKGAGGEKSDWLFFDERDEKAIGAKSSGEQA
jgi:hypothetical protein